MNAPCALAFASAVLLDWLGCCFEWSYGLTHALGANYTLWDGVELWCYAMDDMLGALIGDASAYLPGLVNKVFLGLL
jgi:hypothetical protein